MTSWADFPGLTRNYAETMEKNPEAHGAERISSGLNAKYSKYITAAEKKRWEEGSMSFDEYKRAVAHGLFLKATEYDRETYNNNRKLFADPSNLQYQQLDIENLRKIVLPINGVGE